MELWGGRVWLVGLGIIAVPSYLTYTLIMTYTVQTNEYHGDGSMDDHRPW